MVEDHQVHAVSLAGLFDLFCLARAHEQGWVGSVPPAGDHSLDPGAGREGKRRDFLEVGRLSTDLEGNDQGSGVSSGRGLRGDRTAKTTEVAQKNSGLARVFFEREINGPRGHDGRDGVLVDHLSHGVFKQDHVLIERLDVALQLDAIDQVNRDRDVLAPQNIQKRILKGLTFGL